LKTGHISTVKNKPNNLTQYGYNQ